MSNVTIVLSLTKDELVELVNQHTSKNDVLRSLGVHPYDPRARTALAKMIEEHGIDISHMRRGARYTDEDVIRAVGSSRCISDVLSKIGLTKHGDNFKTIRTFIEVHNLNVSHFSTNDARIHNSSNRKWVPSNIFVEHSEVSRGALRRHVIKHEVLPQYECYECANTGTWNNSPINLVIDHINGVNNDNRIENLRWLCPNCHSQTSTFGTQSKTNHK